MTNYEKAKMIVDTHTEPMKTNTLAGLISYNNEVNRISRLLDAGVSDPKPRGAKRP